MLGAGHLGGGGLQGVGACAKPGVPVVMRAPTAPPAPPQDRFETLVPALSKYGSATVGLTLIVIGATGLYETLSAHPEAAAEPQVALAGAARPQVLPFLNASEVVRGRLHCRAPLRLPARSYLPACGVWCARRGRGVRPCAHRRARERQQHELAARLVQRPCARRTATPLRPRRGAQEQAAAPEALTLPQRRAGRPGCRQRRPARASGAPTRARSSPASCLGCRRGPGAVHARGMAAEGSAWVSASALCHVSGCSRRQAVCTDRREAGVLSKLTLGTELSTPHLRLHEMHLAWLHQQAALATSVPLPYGSVSMSARDKRARCADSRPHAGRSRTRCSSSCRR